MKNLIFTVLIALISGRSPGLNTKEGPVSPRLSIVAESKFQWTGIAVSGTGRIFVNFPRWSANTPVSVGEIINGKVIPYPNGDWNNWDQLMVRKNKFICVQSVYVDNLNLLWVLDTGQEPKTDSTKAAHLYVFDLADNSLKREFNLPASKITGKSYLNDLRIDNKKQIAYLTDSDVGGIVIFDLRTNEIRRVLAKHHSTLAEVPKITIEGYERTHPVHSDGIALDSSKKYLYYSSLMGENVYRIPTEELLDKRLNDSLLGRKVELFAKTGANDGLIFDKKGNLYLTSLERNAISRLDKKGNFEVVISDEAIKWPDSFAFDVNGDLLFTISQIHLPKDKRGPYRIFRISLITLPQ